MKKLIKIFAVLKNDMSKLNDVVKMVIDYRFTDNIIFLS